MEFTSLKWISEMVKWDWAIRVPVRLSATIFPLFTSFKCKNGWQNAVFDLITKYQSEGYSRNKWQPWIPKQEFSRRVLLEGKGKLTSELRSV